MTFDELRLKLEESRGHVYILDAACDSLYPTFAKLFDEVERLQAIVDLFPKFEDKPMVPRVDPCDGTAERLGVVFRYIVEAEWQWPDNGAPKRTE